jgi:hypothetical protein
MDVLMSPFVNLWTWVDRVGGFPGKAVFVIGVVMLVLGIISWVNGKNR